MRHTARPPVTETGLDRLLEAEAELAERLAEARAEAERLVATARVRAAEREAGLAAELDGAARVLEASVVADRDARCTALLLAARGRAAAWDAIDHDRLGRLADVVVNALLEDAAA